LFRYGTHFISSAEFGGQIVFENSRFAEKDSDVNDLIQQSSLEFQSALGSSDSSSMSLSVPVNAASIDTGGQRGSLSFSGSSENKDFEGYKKTSKRYNA
jgi:hypothetical protein